ncbi:MAG: energy transducer TonB, partial [Vicingaceae bacterium]|nr:energy transducer TonB [Vicingaceae bacterium]
FFSVSAQEEVVVQRGEYVEAQNYGGKKELKRFLLQEMNYPKGALLNKIEGVVEVASIVDRKTGLLNKVHVKKSVSKELDVEAVRLYKMMLYTPPFYKGDKKVEYSTLKFKFSIKNYKRSVKKRGYENPVEKYDNVLDTFKVYQDNQVRIKPIILFEDSLETMSSFIQKNLKYPQGTLSLNITGTVKLLFVVEPSGRVTNVKVQRSVGGGATEEAIRLLLLTKWKAGGKDDGKVRVSKVFEVDFNLSNESGMGVAPNSY